MQESTPLDYLHALQGVEGLLEDQARLEAMMQTQGAELGRIRREGLPDEVELQQRKNLGRVMMELGGIRREIKHKTTTLNQQIGIDTNT